MNLQGHDSQYDSANSRKAMIMTPNQNYINNQNWEDLPTDEIRKATMDICEEISSSLRENILAGLKDWAFRARQGEMMSTQIVYELGEQLVLQSSEKDRSFLQ